MRFINFAILTSLIGLTFGHYERLYARSAKPGPDDYDSLDLYLRDAHHHNHYHGPYTRRAGDEHNDFDLYTRDTDTDADSFDGFDLDQRDTDSTDGGLLKRTRYSHLGTCYDCRKEVRVTTNSPSAPYLRCEKTRPQLCGATIRRGAGGGAGICDAGHPQTSRRAQTCTTTVEKPCRGWMEWADQ